MPDDSQIRNLSTLHPYDRITNPVEFICQMGAAIHQSGFFGCVNEMQGRVIAADCLARKTPILERAATDHIIEGKLSMRADAMLAAFIERGGKVKWLKLGDDGIEARAKWTDREGQTLEVPYTIEDAKRAKLVKADKPNSNWHKTPGEMLRARLISKAVRLLDPKCIAGRYTPEELDPDSAGAVEETQYVPVENTEGTKSLAEITTPATVTTTPTTSAAPVAPTESAPALPTLDASEPGITVFQLSRLRPLKDELGIPTDKWQAVLQKNYGVTSAKNLTEAQAEKLLANLEGKVKQKQMNEWAANVQGTAAPAGAARLNDAGELQPPFETGSPPTPQT